MSAATESPDISQLKAFALGLDSLEVRQQYRDPTGQRSISNATHKAPVTHADPQNASAPNLHPPMSLPRNVPETVRARMQGVVSQSPKDTQSASQWVYDAFANSISQNQVPDHGGASTAESNGKAFDDNQGDAAGKPLAGEDFSESQIDDDIDIPSQDIRAEPFPENKRFRLPKTPASQSRKRKRSTLSEPEELDTPLLPKNPFANRQQTTNFMGPSQLFNATQAQTSPLNVVSDAISDRPSPVVQRPTTAGTASSPPPPLHSNVIWAPNEPQTRYVSMKQSQEAREQAKRLEEQAYSPDELSDEEFAQPDSYIRRKLERKRIDDAARQQIDGLISRTQHKESASIRKRKGRVKEKTQSSPLQQQQERNDITIISDDVPIDGMQGSITEEETDREDPASSKPTEHVENVTEDNKENVEVPMTVSRNARLQEHSVTQSSPLAPSAFRSTRVTRASQAKLHSNELPADTVHDLVGQSSLGSEAFAVVADSQPSQQRARKGKSPACSREQTAPSSSSDSRAMIPQSQPIQGSDSSQSVQETRKRSQIVSVPPNDKSRPATISGKVHVTNVNWHPENSKSSSSGLNTITDPSNLTSRDSKSRPSPHTTSASGAGEIEHLSPERGPIVNELKHKLTKRSIAQRTTSNTTNSSTTNAQTSAAPSTYYETARETASGNPQSTRSTARSSKLSTSPTKQRANGSRRREQPELEKDDMDFDLLGDDDHEFLNTMTKLSSAIPTPQRSRSARKMPKSLVVNARPDIGHSSDVEGFHSPSAPAFSQLTPPQSSSQEFEVQTAPEMQENGPEALPEPLKITKPSPRPPELPPTATQSDDGEPVRAHRNRRKGGVITPSSLSQVVRLTTHATTNAPNRVFAHFNGRDSNYFPATCIGATQEDDPRYEVIFDDGNHSVVSAYGIKRLELRAGDVCKIDAQGTRTGTFLVKQMRGHIADKSLASPTPGTKILSTDQRGHTLVALAPKAGKRRRSTDSEDEAGENEVVAPIWRIYFTQTMWGNLKDRGFLFCSSGVPNPLIPAVRSASPPASSLRAKRGRSFTVNASRSVTAPSTPNKALFSDMAFALTNIVGNGVLNHLSSNIKHHGGRILEAGFDDLFQVPSLSRTTSPSKKESTSFGLKPDSADLGFVCLVADRHCRRAKYIQALALGVPCLATRWVTDSITKSMLLPISPYLLPSGESAHLNGAIRSRVFAALPDPNTSTLQDIFDSRPKMLEGASVILIMQKGEEQSMAHHNFLTYALGAARVIRASTIENAAKAVRDSDAGWDFVFSYDRERETERILHGSASRKGRHAEIGWFGKRRACVVGNEYVIQSLILGQLIDT